MAFKTILASIVLSIFCSVATGQASDLVHPAHRLKNACRVFGDDFINVPGTATCVKIYGRISGAISGGSTLNATFFDPPGEKENKHHLSMDTQGRLGLESFTPTSLGKLHARLELRGDLGNGLGYIDYAHLSDSKSYYHGNNLNTIIHFAYAEIGGLRFGVDESIFNYWADNFGGVENDNILNPLAHRSLNAISYSYSDHKNLSAIIGLESTGDRPTAISLASDYHMPVDIPVATGRGPESASLVAGVKYEQPWGSLVGVAAYDSYVKKTSAKLRFDKNINKYLTIFALGSVKSGKDTKILQLPVDPENPQLYFKRFSAWSPYSDWDGKWEAIVGGSYFVNPKVTFNTQFGYTAAKTMAASANFVYALAKGLTVTPELSYLSWNDDSTYAPPEKTDKSFIFKNELKGKHEVQALLKLCYQF